MAGAKTTKKAPATKATAKEEKPKANTKAKVTKPVANGTTSAAPKPRGRPKKTADDAEKADSVADVKPKATRKRKATDEPEEVVTKKTKTAAKGPVINERPDKVLNVYVFGEGSSGELGLGTAKTAIDVKRPRLNPNLSATDVGVVQIATGGMHVAALTKDNKILTWGVNDQGALGRDTAWEGGLKDMDDNASDDSDDSGDDAGLNPRESTPAAIPSSSFPEGTVFVQLAAGDSTTFALTDDGHVYGWGTFRSNEGIFGFTAEGLASNLDVQRTPILIPTLKKIKKIVCGANHALALDSAGSVFAWGSGQQNQLGRRVVERTKAQGLIPREFGLPKKSIIDVACGQYHSFAIDTRDRVWAWGLNNYGETGVDDAVGEDEAVVLKPAVVETLSGKGVSVLSGGAHHSVAVTHHGECLAWGRVDGCQVGIPLNELKEDEVVKDERGAVRILKVPTLVTAIEGKVETASASSDHAIAVTTEGKAWAWGFSANYQTGLGTDDDVAVATLIDNTAVRGKKIIGAHTGGQYGILTEVAGDAPKVNGTK